MSDNARRMQATEPASLQEVLYAMNEAGGFQAAVLTCPEGLPIAAIPASYEGDATAAIVALFRRVSNQVRNQLEMAMVDELTVLDHRRIRLVCRYLIVGERELILAVMIPPGRPYRRVTNRAIRQIKELLSRA